MFRLLEVWKAEVWRRMGDRWAKVDRKAGRTERAVGAAKACLRAGRRAEEAMVEEGWGLEGRLLARESWGRMVVGGSSCCLRLRPR